MKNLIATLLAAACLSPGMAWADAPADPLRSIMWSTMTNILESIHDGDIVMDDSIKVETPSDAEDQMQVPVTVDASAVGDVTQIVVLTDLNPIHHVLTYEPVEAAPYISFRVKVEQATPVRAAALTRDGKWHVGSAEVNAAGGGCTAPALSRNQDDWVDHLVKVRAKIWRYANEPDARLRFRIQHPMDTGLADGIPAFYMNKMDVKAPDGRTLARIEIRQPVSEHPTFTVKPKLEMSETFLHLKGRDTDGNLLDLKVPAPHATSSAALVH